MNKISTIHSLKSIAVILIGLLLVSMSIDSANAQNYGIRDDGGVNLPTVTYWYTGTTVDSTVQGADFDGTDFGVVSAFIFKDADIKTWKSDGGDVTGAQFNYKVWEIGETEPASYTVRNIGWSLNEGGGNQIWGSFGDQIDVASGLTAGMYNVKILFSISGTGTPGTTEDGPYTASFEIPSVSSAAEIVSFTVPEQVVATDISSAEGTIEIGVLDGTDVTSLVPTIVISDGASVDPASGVAQDFSSDVIYTVTAEDNVTTKTWTVSVAFYTPNYGIRDDGGVNLPTLSYLHSEIADPVTEQGTDFNGSDFGEVSTFSFTGAAIKIWKSGSGDVYNTHFNYKVWADGDAEPDDYITHDVGWTANDSTGYQTWAGFGSPLNISNGLDAGVYNIKVLFSISGTGVPGISEDGPYLSTFEIPGISSAAEIITFEFAEQVEPAVLNSIDGTIDLTVYPDADITDLVPTIVISEGATIDPMSGVSQDFTAPFTYTVTAEDQTTTKDWTVTVTVAEPNYGLRDDEGVNLPDVTYWYTGIEEDSTEQGADFEGQALGAIDAYFLKGATIKTWKAGEGDVTGAQLNYKVWSVDSLEPADYSIRNVNWTSDDGDGNQTWSDFGDAIDITSGLEPGDYNIKILFSMSGNGIPGITENGPFSQTFTLQASNNIARIDAQYISCGVNDSQQSFGAEMFDGLDFGEITPPSGLWLYGGGIQTFELGSYSFINSRMYYRVYEDGSAAGTFSYVDLPFVEELPTPGEEVWETLTQDIDLSTGLSNGDYNFEIYFEAKYTTSDGGDTITIIKDNAGSNYVALFNFNDGTGINSSNTNDLKIYPNPATNMIYIDLDNSESYTKINLYSADGRLVFQKDVIGLNKVEMPVSQLTAGMYLVNIQGENKSISTRIIIE
jgi:hypothetical protein